MVWLRDQFNKLFNQSPAEQFTDNDDGQLNASDRYDDYLNIYDTNRNGVFDRDEVVCILDDYEETQQANKDLAKKTPTRRR